MSVEIRDRLGNYYTHVESSDDTMRNRPLRRLITAGIALVGRFVGAKWRSAKSNH